MEDLPMHEHLSDSSRELINEPGSIGEEQLPIDAGDKNDKQAWTYAADKIDEDVTWWQRLRNFFKGGT
jgi:hypothetical protein